MSEDTIEKLKELSNKGLTELEIYYAEDMEGVTNYWSIDVLNNILCDLTNTNWIWTVTSTEWDRICREEYDDDTPNPDYEIIVNENFSDNVICEVIQTWLESNGFHDFDVVMIDFEDATPYAGYIRKIMSRNLEEEIKNAVPLE